ncbi:hypothetical protein Pfo_001815, partial [Paulownia fortunei]
TKNQSLVRCSFFSSLVQTTPTHHRPPIFSAGAGATSGDNLFFYRQRKGLVIKVVSYMDSGLSAPQIMEYLYC